MVRGRVKHSRTRRSRPDRSAIIPTTFCPPRPGAVFYSSSVARYPLDVAGAHELDFGELDSAGRNQLDQAAPPLGNYLVTRQPPESHPAMAAAAAYRLEAPRSRIPPPPIRVQSPSYRSSTVFRKSVGEPELLYDLPTSSISVSSPPPTSPTSPTSHVARRRAVSPPASRARSSTPSQPLKSDLERFADQCRAWYVPVSMGFLPTISLPFSARYQVLQSGR